MVSSYLKIKLAKATVFVQGWKAVLTESVPFKVMLKLSLLLVKSDVVPEED